MKMIIAILPDTDTDTVTQTLIENQFRVTRIASTGGFLRSGMTTLLIGLEDDQVQEAIDLVRNACAPAIEPAMARTTLFVLPVEHFEQV